MPYSLALPFVLTVYRLALRFGAAVDQDLMRSRLHVVDQVLARIEDEVEGRLSRGLVQVQNARDALRGHASEAPKRQRPAAAAAEASAEALRGGSRCRARLTPRALALTLSRSSRGRRRRL